MLKFAVHRYSLNPLTNLNKASSTASRPGALLKITWPDKKTGYADLFPWPEFGDLPLEDQLLELSRGHITPMLEQSIWLARRDAKLRALKKNALQETQKVKNHFVVSDFTNVSDQKLNDLKSAGYTTLKVKMGRDWNAEFHWLTKIMDRFSFMLRLDFNSQGDFSTYERLMTAWNPGHRRKIDFVEDPFPFAVDTWTEASKFSSLALDFEFDKVDWEKLPEKLPFDFLVIKPARQDVEKSIKLAKAKDLKVVFTSSMDHALGVVHSAHVASEFKTKNPNMVVECGCLTTHLYMPNEFSSRMIVQGPYLTQVPGKGVGFDEILGEIKWQPVKVL